MLRRLLHILLRRETVVYNGGKCSVCTVYILSRPDQTPVGQVRRHCKIGWSNVPGLAPSVPRPLLCILQATRAGWLSRSDLPLRFADNTGMPDAYCRRWLLRLSVPLVRRSTHGPAKDVLTSDALVAIPMRTRQLHHLRKIVLLQTRGTVSQVGPAT